MQTVYRSHSGIAPFRLLRPRGAAEAAAMRAEAGGDGAYLAGGIDLVPALRAGRRAGTIIALDRLDGFARAERREHVLRLGAGMTYAALATDPVVAAALPDLALLAGTVANVRVRHVATLGGNVMAGNPGYDALPVLLALGATFNGVGGDGRRHQADDVATQAPDALIDSIDIPLVGEQRLVLDRSHKPVASVAIAIWRAHDRFAGRVAIGCAFAKVQVAPLPCGPQADFAALAGDAEGIARRVADTLPDPLDDWIASGAYRRDLVRVLVARGLRRLAARP